MNSPVCILTGGRTRMKILLFGTGDYYNRYKKWFVRQDVTALLDNSRQKQHTIIDGLEVLSPEEGIRLDYDAIVILSFYVKQMKQQLLSLGVEPEKIYHFYDLHQLIAHDAVSEPVQYYPDAEEITACGKPGECKILLLSNDLLLGGPEIALFHAAQILKKNGYPVVFASMTDGPLKKELIRSDIPVIVDENLQIATMHETAWVKAFSLVLCNTLNFHVFLSERDTGIPVVWWLHDARFFYDGVSRETMKKISLHNLTAVSVGPVPAAAIREFLPDLECSGLLYGVADAAKDETVIRRAVDVAKDGTATAGADVCCREMRTGSGRVRFITIGFLEERKGQDILLQAVRSLPDSIRHNSKFYIAGHGNTLFGENLRSKCAEDKGIVFTGSVSRGEIHRLLGEADVLVCPSREDPMPTVAAEAMMHSVPCIVSDAAGTAAYIHDGGDGLVFPSGDAQALAKKIMWCVTDREKLAGMGKKARKLYEKYFSMPAFEKRFMEIIQATLAQK